MTLAPQHQILYRGMHNFVINSDPMITLDIPALPLERNERVLLSIRNTSAAFDITANLGHKEQVLSYIRGSQASIACTSSNANDWFTTATAHNFNVGDRVVFSGTGGGVTANIYYWIHAVPNSTTFQVSATRGGSLQTLNADAANVVDYAPSPTGSVSVASAAATTNIFTTSTPHGLAIGDAIVFAATSAKLAVTAGVIYYVTATATTTTFTISTARAGTAVDVTDTDTGSFQIAQEFFALTNGSTATTITVPKWAALGDQAPVAGLVSAVVQGWGHTAPCIQFEKGSLADGAAFDIDVIIRRA